MGHDPDHIQTHLQHSSVGRKLCPIYVSAKILHWGLWEHMTGVQTGKVTSFLEDDVAN